MYSGRQYWNGGVWLGSCYAWDSSFEDGLHTPIHAPKIESASTGYLPLHQQTESHLSTLQSLALVAGFFCACDTGNEPTIDYISVAPVTRQMNNVKYQVPNLDHMASI